jgi:hypothetical protein
MRDDPVPFEQEGLRGMRRRGRVPQSRFLWPFVITRFTGEERELVELLVLLL